jgi:hypothetical protein
MKSKGKSQKLKGKRAARSSSLFVLKRRLPYPIFAFCDLPSAF